MLSLVHKLHVTAIRLAMSPSLIKACSSFSDHGFEKFSRRQFRYCWRAEKIGPGAMLMPLDSAARWSSRVSAFPGNSTQRTGPPWGRETRVPAGKLHAMEALM